MIAEQHTQPLAFAFAMRIQEKVVKTVSTESVSICEAARQKMHGIIDAKWNNHLSQKGKFTGATALHI